MSTFFPGPVEIALAHLAVVAVAAEALWNWTTNPVSRPKRRHLVGNADMALAVIDDLHARRQIGMDRYGTPLMADTLADPLWPAYEEWMDQGIYLRAEIEKRKTRAA
jgi:hypothetical protein